MVNVCNPCILYYFTRVGSHLFVWCYLKPTWVKLLSSLLDKISCCVMWSVKMKPNPERKTNTVECVKHRIKQNKNT